MGEYLDNSTRSLYKATYESKKNDNSSNANVVEKKSLLANWMVTEKELDAIKAKTADLSPTEKKKVKDALEIIKPIVVAGDSVEAIKISSQLATVDYKTLVKIGYILAEIRKTERLPVKTTKGVTPSPSIQPASVVTSNEILNSTHQFEERMKKSNYGWIHLEQLDMKPSGETVEGELLYSLPLAPNEKVTLTHKEWSSQSKDLEKMVTDVLETTEEQSVEDKRDSSMSTETQSQISTAFAVSGGYSGFGFSMSANYGRTTNDQISQKVSEQHATNLTKKASARARKEHKTTIKVSSASGFEESSERIVVNNYPDHVLQLDYHRQMREWEVTLTRTGMRLAYDIVLPNPAKDIIQKHMELKKIEDQLIKPFQFDLSPQSIEFENQNADNFYLKLSEKYGESIESPKVETVPPKVYTMQTRSDDDTQYGLIEMDIPPNHSIKKISVQSIFTTNDSDHLRYLNFSHPALQEKFRYEHVHDGGPDNAVLIIPENEKYEEIFVGVTGKLVINFTWASFRDLKVVLKVILKIDESLIEQWKMTVWQKLHNKAQEQYEKNKEELEERRAKLLEEISADDALALRGREREEVMKRIISFLFGINFSTENEPTRGLGNTVILNPTLANLIAGTSSVPETAESGEIINFLSHAIEWENVVYVLYPYFWANKENRKYKMFLHHPDKMHRDFLRAGAARVVLTIRRGFESAFVTAMNYGLQAGLATEFPEVPIADDIQREAWKKYKDMPPDKGTNRNDPFPDKDVELKPFATWKEYMPTSGVRVKATKIPVVTEQ